MSQMESVAGHAVNVTFLRRLVARTYVNSLWQRARESSAIGLRHCPACRRKMVRVGVTAAPEPYDLDVCKTCEFIWFDPRELEMAPAATRDRRADPERLVQIPQTARELIAIHRATQLGEAQQECIGTDPPAECWKWLPAILGFPVVYDPRPLRQLPAATLGLLAIIVFSSVSASSHLEAAVENFALIPVQFWRSGGLTLLSSVFIHGGFIHLLGNAYFLVVFGEDVEDFIGRRRFLLLFLLAALAGGLFHVIANFGSRTPCVGASGAISGVITFYALQFPKAHLGIMARVFGCFRWVRMEARLALCLWLAVQLFTALMQISGLTRVSAMAHLGGGCAGLLFWTWQKRSICK